MSSSCDLLVVGGGVMGLLSALKLAERGLKVTLLERSELMAEASWAGGGILSPLYPWRYAEAVTALARYSQRCYSDFVEDLRQQSGIDPQFRRSGLLVSSSDDNRQAFSWAAQHGAVVDTLGANQTALLQPGLGNLAEQWLWMPNVATVRNPRLGQALVAVLKQHASISIITQRPVEGFLQQHGRVTGVRTSKGDLSADQVLVCAGSWSGGVLESLPCPPRIEPVKGEMLLFKAPPGMLKRVVLHSGYYLIPRADGRILAGSTLERAGFDKRPSRLAHSGLHRAALSLLPALKRAPIEAHWSGLRPGSPSGIPYICPVPGLRNLWLNAGQFRNGLVLAPASCELIANLICAEPPCVDPAPYCWDAI